MGHVVNVGHALPLAPLLLLSEELLTRLTKCYSPNVPVVCPFPTLFTTFFIHFDVLLFQLLL